MAGAVARLSVVFMPFMFFVVSVVSVLCVCGVAGVVMMLSGGVWWLCCVAVRLLYSFAVGALCLLWLRRVGVVNLNVEIFTQRNPWNRNGYNRCGCYM